MKGKFIIGVMLAGAAWMTLGFTEFNESNVFTNPGIVAPQAENLAQWQGVAASQHVELSPYLSPLKYGLETFLLFMFPPLCMLVWREAERLHNWVNLALLALLMMDGVNMMQLNGYNSANGGYDGAGEMVCYGLHGLFGSACVLLFLTRLAWRVFNRDVD